MKYTIEYLENVAREWSFVPLSEQPREHFVVFEFWKVCADHRGDWEEARLVATHEDGTERKAADWCPFPNRYGFEETLTPKASDLGVSFEAQLAEELGLNGEQRKRLRR